ncbi:hypothetical protein [Gorillibacterium timonense]|uniref:hypothetical protein n=1 Tax=Gorillibacterium timonense TaxID=1689269 RepID=UPI00131C2F8A|nr:hypothetical protein [Gorillibacterium timonense]
MNNLTQATQRKNQRKGTPRLNSSEGRQYMLALVLSVLHQMKLEEKKKGGPQKEHTK